VIHGITGITGITGIEKSSEPVMRVIIVIKDKKSEFCSLELLVSHPNVSVFMSG
jgi:hypothetical protein